VVKYVQALETNYTETIKDLKMLVEKERNRKRKIVAENVNSVQNRNEMETLFVSCIEEVRKDIMKRRLKNEIYNRKKFQ
jgi:serine phosphatase RsbU (regulator of sigma subunit)